MFLFLICTILIRNPNNEKIYDTPKNEKRSMDSQSLQLQSPDHF
jgi:hypothetical protein